MMISLDSLFNTLLQVLIYMPAGIICGIVITIPVTGPVGVYLTGKGIGGKFRQGFYTALGTAIIETVYCLLAILGMTFIFSSRPLKSFTFFTGAALTIIMGVQVYTTEIATKGEKPVPSYLNRFGDFCIGFFITLLNPGIILSWMIILTFFSMRGIHFTLVQGILFAIGVGTGTLIWFCIYLKLLGTVRKSFTEQFLKSAFKFLSSVLIGIGIYLIWSGITTL